MHIGSSGPDFDSWRLLSKFSTVISIDGSPDNAGSNKYKKNIKINNVISNKSEITNFYLTKDTHCSSLLEPDLNELDKWYFKHRFKVTKILKVKTITINQLLKKLKIDYVDWLVIDVQGMDLNILKSIDKKIINKIIFVDMEPGLRSFYKKEAKLHQVLAFMNKKFEIEDINFGFNYKISSDNLSKIDRRSLFFNEKKKMLYANILFKQKKFNGAPRNKLLYLIFLISKKRIFEANEFINSIDQIDDIFYDIKKYLKLRLILFKLRYIICSPYLILKKVLKEIIAVL